MKEHKQIIIATLSVPQLDTTHHNDKVINPDPILDSYEFLAHHTLQ